MAMAEIKSHGSPPPKKKRLSLSLKTRRFASNTKPEALEKAAEGRNKKRPEEPIDPQILTVDDTTNLCLVLRLFVLEARKANGDSYPPSTIRNLLSGINRELTKTRLMWLSWIRVIVVFKSFT
uniref:Uncharacterized protein n=1 Tax=Amphimedon queenslandica TaxID=400682 RepID=A0A1X7T6K0_AMPQE